MKIQFKRNLNSSSAMLTSVNAGEPIWYMDHLYIGSVGGTNIANGDSSLAAGTPIEIARGDHDHTGVYQPVGNYLTSWNAADNYAFKTVAPGSASSSVTAPTANTTSQTADSNTDTLTITPSNKWIGVGGSATDSSDILYIGHALSGVTAGTYKSVTVDEAGHVTAGSNPTTLAGYGITDGDMVKQVLSSSNVYGRLMITANNTNAASGSITNNTVSYAYYTDKIMANPSTGEIVATSVRASGTTAADGVFVGSASGSQCHQQYDATNQCLKFIFD